MKTIHMTKLVITGNPGVGKHTSAKMVIKRIGSGTIIDINKVATSHNALFKRRTKYGMEVDTKKVAKLLASQLEQSKGIVIVVGHLAPYVLEPARIDLVIVLRRSPYELIRIFEERGYSLHKTRQNVASEILDISLYDSLQTFGKEKIAELDTTPNSPEDTANDIVLLLRQKRSMKIGTVDWLSLVHKNGDLNKLLEY
jgi:adenylate kinase